MLEKIVSEYALKELLEIDNCPLAIADPNQKIIWFNKSFKQNSGLKKIKGQSIYNLFNVEQPVNIDSPSKAKAVIIPIPAIKGNLKISVLRSAKKLDGFLLHLNIQQLPREEPLSNADIKLMEKNLIFQKELHEILSLLIKENSLNVLAEEILKKCVNISKSNFGLIAFFDDKKKYYFLTYDPNKEIKNQADVEKEIHSSLSFITKWFNVNKRSLLAENHPNNIGFNLTRIFQCEYLIITPCFFDEKLLAAIITGKKDESFLSDEINSIEHFGSLLSFAISNIKTQELNAALENRLIQAQKLETIGKLTSGMAHDFSNLLSSIFGSLNLLRKRVPENETIYRLIDNIENCSVRAKDLTKGLLIYGKPTPKRKEVIKPDILISEISKIVTQTFPKSIGFETNIEENLKDILGNGTEIYQVLLNLCVNAKEAIEGKGKISLNAKNIKIDDKNIIEFPWLEKGNYICFSVKDTGTGIKEEDLRSIFDPYFSTKEKETGSGLGLYVTYGIIKAHKGYVDVSSEVGKGTQFDVYIPSFERAEIARTPLSSEKIILLADDELMLRDLLAELLESHGYNVIKVSTGVEALKILTEEIKVDLVIMDYNMPEMNGIECIQKIKELKFTMPIILSTGSLSLDENIDPRAIGANMILPKPYEFDSMLNSIRKLI